MVRAASDIAVERYACSQCGAAAGVECRTPSGKRVRSDSGNVHASRIGLLTLAEWQECTVRIETFDEVLARLFGPPKGA